VLTLHSSKGLEFPIVALAGFHGSRYDREWHDITEEEREELFLRGRRLLFVGMTRAMRTLLVLVPEGTQSPLLTGFDATYWDIEVEHTTEVSQPVAVEL
jgi:superfamily I DNA/RNA helicase